MNENKGKSRKKLRKTIKKLKHRVSELESGNESSGTRDNKLFLDFSHILKLVAREFKKIKQMSFEEQKKAENELQNIDLDDSDSKMVDVLQSLVSNQKFNLSTQDLNSFGRELKYNPDKNKEYPCLFNYDNVKLKEGRSEWQTKLYEGEKDGKKYIIKTRVLKPMTIFQQKRLEKEIRLGKIASTKRLGPIIEDIFYCKDETSAIVLYIVYERISAGSLSDWTEKHKLTQNDKNKIKKLVDKLYDNDIMPDYIGDTSILVDDTNPKKVRFYFNGYSNSSSLEDIISERKESSSKDLEWLSNFNQDKINNIVCNKLVKQKMIKYKL
jgi:hypothetical protein